MKLKESGNWLQPISLIFFKQNEFSTTLFFACKTASEFSSNPRLTVVTGKQTARDGGCERRKESNSTSFQKPGH